MKSCKSSITHHQQEFGAFLQQSHHQTLGTSICQSAPKPKQPAPSANCLRIAMGMQKASMMLQMFTWVQDPKIVSLAALCIRLLYAFSMIRFSTLKLHSFRQTNRAPKAAESQLTFLLKAESLIFATVSQSEFSMMPAAHQPFLHALMQLGFE